MAKRKWKVRQLSLPLPPDPALVQAMRDAREIREWTDGPSPAPIRVLRLAHALCGHA